MKTQLVYLVKAGQVYLGLNGQTAYFCGKDVSKAPIFRTPDAATACKEAVLPLLRKKGVTIECIMLNEKRRNGCSSLRAIEETKPTVPFGRRYITYGLLTHMLWGGVEAEPFASIL